MSRVPEEPNFQFSLINVPSKRQRTLCLSHMSVSIPRESTSQVLRQGVPVVAQWLTNLTNNYEDVGSIPGLAQWLKDLALP